MIKVVKERYGERTYQKDGVVSPERIVPAGFEGRSYFFFHRRIPDMGRGLAQFLNTIMVHIIRNYKETYKFHLRHTELDNRAISRDYMMSRTLPAMTNQSSDRAKLYSVSSQ